MITYPTHLVLPLREAIREFMSDMGTTDDQHYDTDEVVRLMIEAACGLNPDRDLDEVVEHFAQQHTPIFKGPARQFLGTLGYSILQTIHGFGYTSPDGRFPYTIAEHSDGLYLMEKFR